MNDLFGPLVSDETERDVPPMRVAFSTGSVHARDRLDYWRSEASKVYVEHEFDTPVGRSFHGEIRSASVAEMGIACFDCDPAIVGYTARCIRQARDDDVIISRQIRGSILQEQDGRVLRSRPGDLWLIDPRRPFRCEIRPDTSSICLRIPRHELEARLGDISRFTARAVSGDKPIASLASGFIDLIARQSSSIDDSAATKVMQQAIDLLALAIKSEMAEGPLTVASPRAVTLLRLKAVIEEKLRDPALKPATAAAAAGISVRYANALLAEEGTSLERHIMNRRLENCRRDLMAPAHATRMVSDVAYGWGFSDLSHFTRRFKARFGRPPGQIRPPFSQAS